MTRAARVFVFVVTCGAGWLLAGADVLACPVCFQVEASPVTEGIQAAVWVLVTITGAVLGGFGVFVRQIARRSAGVPDRPDAAHSPEFREP